MSNESSTFKNPSISELEIQLTAMENARDFHLNTISDIYDVQKRQAKEITELNRKLNLYIKAINTLDDKFEYGNESTSDRIIVQGTIDKLTEQLGECNDVDN